MPLLLLVFAREVCADSKNIPLFSALARRRAASLARVPVSHRSGTSDGALDGAGQGGFGRMDDVEEVLANRGRWKYSPAIRLSVQPFVTRDYQNGLLYDASETAPSAKNALVLQGLDVAGGYILKSSLDWVYRDVLAGLRTVSRYTTLNLVKNGSSHTDNQLPNASLRLQGSLSRGIETRLKVGESLGLRYGLISGDILIDYDFDF